MNKQFHQVQSTTSPENSPVLEKEQFQRNADFIHQQWKPANIEGWHTRIMDIGEGSPIVFVPICQGLEAFDSLLIRHFSKNHRVITYQRREDENRILDRESRARDLHQVVRHLGIEKAHFVSHSSGSIAATTLALEHPSLFLSYVWMNLSPKPAMDMPWFTKWLANSVHYIPLSDHQTVSLVANTCSGGERSSLLYARAYDQFMAIKKTAGVTSVKRWFERNVWSSAKYDWSASAALEKLTMPVLVVNSDNDTVNSEKAMGLLEKQLPNSYGYKIVKGGRHFFHYPCADQVIDYMEAFYTELEKSHASRLLVQG